MCAYVCVYAPLITHTPFTKKHNSQLVQLVSEVVAGESSEKAPGEAIEEIAQALAEAEMEETGGNK